MHTPRSLTMGLFSTFFVRVAKLSKPVTVNQTMYIRGTPHT